MEKETNFDDLMRPLEMLLEGHSDVNLRHTLLGWLSRNAAGLSEYMCQMRLHLMLEEYFSLEKAARRRRPEWLKVAAVFLLIVGISIALLFRAHRPFGRSLCVAASAMPILTAEEREMLKACYFAELSNSDGASDQLVKYEPGKIENPGAAIEVVQMSTGKSVGHHLNEGDRVWRQNVVLPDGKMSFKVGGQGLVTVVGPAAVKLHDEKTIEVVSGCVYIEARRAISLILSGRRLTLDNASAGVVARHDGTACDFVVTEGIVLLGERQCLREQDGVRIMVGGVLQAFRSSGNGQSLRGEFLAGISNVEIRDEWNHVF